MKAKKVLIIGTIYISYLLLGTGIFQLLENRSKEDRCTSAKLKAKHYKDDIISKGFYRFGYHKKICRVLNHTYRNHGKVHRDKYIDEERAQQMNYRYACFYVSSLFEVKD